jgi:AraC family ethanolamine operon transcriptional activator
VELKQTASFERTALGDTYALDTLKWAQLGEGSLQFRYGIIAAGPIELSVRAFSTGFALEADLTHGRLVMALLADPRAKARWFGSEVDKNYVYGTRGHVDFSVAQRGATYRVRVDERALRQLFPAAPDVHALSENAGSVILTQNATLAARLRSALHRLFSTATSSEASFSPYGVPSKIVYGTIVPLLSSALESFDEHGVEASKCLTRRLAAVRKCEEYMRNHADATLTLLDLSQVSGMRSRSLINAFEAVTGFSPMDYLKRLRLNGVRRTLERADPSRTRIIDVATDWGFWHMGHFTGDYRTMFGESPSQTLRN